MAISSAPTDLGLLRDPDLKVLRQGREFVNVTPEVRVFLAEATPVIVTKANIKSRVHRRVHMDYVGLKLYSPEGLCQGELRIVGLFTANAYDSPVAAVPYLRRKADAVLARAALDPSSYAGRALKNVLETYPRDELFQIDVETLYHFVSEILTLSERPRIRALARLDRFNRFVSILVFISKDRYDSAIRQKVGAFLANLYAGRLSAAYPSYPDGPLARTHFIIGRDGGETPERAARDARGRHRRDRAQLGRRIAQRHDRPGAGPSRHGERSNAISTLSDRPIGPPTERRPRSTTSPSSRRLAKKARAPCGSSRIWATPTSLP